jgi:predicted ATPase
MKRYILTGTPGAGKTAILRQLECDGFSVVEEAATDLIALRQAQGIAEPWTHPSFIDAVAELQKRREQRAAHETSVVQFHDRSVICTVALATYLGFPVTDVLTREVNRIVAEATFEKRVFFIRSLGFVARTEARRITLDEAVRFEKIHEDTYRELDFEIVSIPPGSVAERVDAIARAISEASR